MTLGMNHAHRISMTIVHAQLQLDAQAQEGSRIRKTHLVEVSQTQQHPAIPIVFQGEQLHALGQASLICKKADWSASCQQALRRPHSGTCSGCCSFAKGQD